MDFLRYRREQLADYLRKCITTGELTSPLPAIHDWALQLGVGHGTLQGALKILKLEGLVGSRSRKDIYLIHKSKHRPQLEHTPLVRWLSYRPKGTHFQNPSMGVLTHLIGGKLAAQHIEFQWEYCDDDKIKAIQKKGPQRRELLIFVDLPSLFARMFLNFNNVLLIGIYKENAPLPYIHNNIIVTMRHAVYFLVRRGFDHVSLAVYEDSDDLFEPELALISKNSPRPVKCDVMRLSKNRSKFYREILTFSSKIRGRHGFIINAPIPPGLFTAVAVKAGLKIPDMVDFIGLNTLPDHMLTVPLIIHYPFPLNAFQRLICKLSVHYFYTGMLPPGEKVISLNLEFSNLQ